MAKPLRRLLATRLRARSRALASDESGATLIEFGLLFPILSLMVLATIDLGTGLTTRFSIEQAAQRTIELAALGGRPRADYSFLEDEAEAAAQELGVENAVATLDQWLECRAETGELTQEDLDFDASCASGEQSARYVSITITADYMPMFEWIPIIGSIGNRPDGSIRLTADSGVRVQ